MPSIIYQEIGLRIREVRKQKKLTQAELSSRMELTRTSITNIENGRQTVPVHVLYEFAKSLGVSPADLLPDPNEMSTVEANVEGFPIDTGELSIQELSWVRKIRRTANEGIK